MTRSEKQHSMLGMPAGTASAKLRKQLLFEMARDLDRLRCFRCGVQIEAIDDFSIEHKVSWALVLRKARDVANPPHC